MRTYEELFIVNTSATDSGVVQTEKAWTINKPADELYRFWRDFTNLPQFMKHLEAVTVLDERRSHWVARAPVGMTVEWDAEIVDERPNELIAWRSLPGAQVENSGSVRFVPAPGNHGTEVRVRLEYKPPAGAVGVAIAKLLREEPTQQVEGDVRRFKQLMEAGELPTNEGQPAGGKRAKQ
ncbi:MAG: SRPBCC family protein [Chloroflexaceae bacterium]|nr:SRPBCC family protein [Chloroflexaceae bacterium]